MTEPLYCETHRIQVKCPDSEDKQVRIKVAVEIQTTTSPLHRKDLLVRLTDDKDPFFLYNLSLGEEDFQSLKTQQGLLVDFSAFPQRFIALLQQCRSEETGQTPKFLLQFDMEDSSSSSFSGVCLGNGTLKVIETNPFKHLIHLSLNLIPGNDSDVKKYLATCLKLSLEKQRNLEETLHNTETDLRQKLEQTKLQLSDKSRDLDKIRVEAGGRSERLTMQHTRELNLEREKALKAQEDMQQRYDRERKEMESSYQKTFRQKDARLSDLENLNKELTDRRYRAEATIREQKTKLNALDEEHRRCRSELQQVRRENCSLDSERHSQDKTMQQLKTRVAVLEQELLDKEQLVARISSSLEGVQEQKDQLEDRRSEQQSQIRKLEATIKTMSEELMKGNEIIKKLQDELRGYVSKVKLKNEVTTKQEHLIGEKQKQMEKNKKELDEATDKLKKSDDEVVKLKEQLKMTIEKLEESKGLLKTNENVINWLNKQLNDRQMTSRRAPSAPVSAHTASHHTAQSYNDHIATSTFQHPLSYERPGPHYSTPVVPNATPPHLSASQSTPIPISASPTAHQMPALTGSSPHLPRPAVKGSPHVVYNPGRKDKENRSPKAAGETSIDPKYLTRSSDVVRSQSPGGAPSPPKTFNAIKQVTKPPPRLSQQVINKATLGKHTSVRFQPQTQQANAVVSAYFTGAIPKQS